MDQVLTEPIATSGRFDMDLVIGARAGDREAFDRLMVGRLEPTFRTAMAILGHEADARDATQIAFVKAWRDLPALRDVERFDAWFGRILVNTCRTALRRRRRAHVREIPVTSVEATDRPPSRAPDRFEDRAAELDLLERAFERLAGDQRVLLVLHHLDQRPLAAIAAMLGIPEGTAKSRLYHARRALERALEDERR
jgi:RNA polymerase sigma-70 factor (ECF subfamily)